MEQNLQEEIISEKIIHNFEFEIVMNKEERKSSDGGDKLLIQRAKDIMARSNGDVIQVN